MTMKMTLRVLVFAACLLPFIAQSTHAAEYPLPLDRMKEVVLSEGQKSEDGTIVLQKRVTETEYWMIYFPDDGSIGFGKASSSGTYSWGILYDPEGKYLFLETFLGKVVNLYYVQAEGAIEVGNQFIKDLEGWAEDSPEKTINTNWITT